MRTFGEISLSPAVSISDPVAGTWRIKGERHVITRLKRIFEGISKMDILTATLSNTPENCRDLLWFLDRYPMKVSDREILERGARQHITTIDRLDMIVTPGYKPKEYPLMIPLRNYQKVAVEIYLERHSLLLGDDIGIGKTAVAIGSFTNPATLPAVVVTPAHLPKQWANEIRRFMPDLQVHIVKKKQSYVLPEILGRGPDIIIINYHKLDGWVSFLVNYAHSIVFDEVQDLRRDVSQKYAAAKAISAHCQYRLGLTATPIYNYGGEFYNVNEVLPPGILGTQQEFWRAWCSVKYGGKTSIIDPKAFGSYLRENHIMLRRTRQEVGRELPALSKVIHTVDSDSRELHRIKDSATELARIILDRANKSTQERYVASGQFDNLLRQATGLSKALYVADFVRMLLETGEKIVLYGWHREVYSMWAYRLGEFDPAWYTGSESPAKKRDSAERFIKGDTQLLMISLRAGSGLDGLQYSGCRTVVFGELDWSPGVHEQCLSEDTEILTPFGSRGPDKIIVGDMVCAFDINTGNTHWVKSLSKIERPLAHGENMCAVQTEKIDIRVTSEHRMLVRRKTRTIRGIGRSAWYFETAEAVIGKSRRFIPINGMDDKCEGIDLTKDELRLLGLFITDGHFSEGQLTIYQQSEQPWNKNIVDILRGCRMKWSLVKRMNENGKIMNWYIIPKGNLHRWAKNELDKLEKMLSDGMTYKEIGLHLDRTTNAVRRKALKLKRGDISAPVKIRTERGWAVIEKYLDKNMSPALDQMTREQLYHFLDGLNIGDGNKSANLKNCMKITNTNKIFLDRLQSLCIRRGFAANISTRKNRTRTDKIVYDIWISEYNEAWIPHANKPNVFAICSSRLGERVWCVTNDIGTLIIRRNGKVSIIGNCTGRIHRDGQAEPVVSYYLVADDGADPIMVDTLGLKQEQVEGIRNPDDIFPERKGTPPKSIAALAEAYLKDN